MRFRLVLKVIPGPVCLGLPRRGYLAKGVPEPLLSYERAVGFANTFSSSLRIA